MPSKCVLLSLPCFLPDRIVLNLSGCSLPILFCCHRMRLPNAPSSCIASATRSWVAVLELQLFVAPSCDNTLCLEAYSTASCSQQVSLITNTELLLTM